MLDSLNEGTAARLRAQAGRRAAGTIACESCRGLWASDTWRTASWVEKYKGTSKTLREAGLRLENQGMSQQLCVWRVGVAKEVNTQAQAGNAPKTLKSLGLTSSLRTCCANS